MTREAEIALLKQRIQKLKGSDKNVKSGGVLRKCERKLRNLEVNR